MVERRPIPELGLNDGTSIPQLGIALDRGEAGRLGPHPDTVN
jgi:hypothetical protein